MNAVSTMEQIKCFYPQPNLCLFYHYAWKDKDFRDVSQAKLPMDQTAKRIGVFQLESAVYWEN